MATAAQKPPECQFDIDDEYARWLVRKLSQMREDETECNLVIKVEGREIHVHRNIMRAGSDYFDATFSHDTMEKKSGIVEMKGIGFCVAKKCVTYLYTGKISITEGDCEPLLYAAGMMQLAPVCDKISLFLESHLNASSFFNIKRIADKFELEHLSKVCDDFALENFDSLAKEEGFGNLKQEYFSFLITSERLSSSVTEESKLASILQWVKGDIEKRPKSLVDLMNHLDLKKVSLKYGRFLVKNESLCYQSLECMKLLFLGVTEEAPDCNSDSKTALPSDCNALVAFNTESKYLEAYQPVKNSWSRILGLHNRMCQGFYTAVMCNNILYVLMQNMEVYMTDYMEEDPKWVQKRSMTMDHGNYMRAAVHGQFIYVVGKSMERYCTVTEKWEEAIRTDGIPCVECAVAEYKGYIYTIGGFRGKDLSDVNKLSPSLQTWSPVKPMLEARDAPAVAVYDEKMFVVGGTRDCVGGGGKSTHEAEFYDINLDSWTRISRMNVGRFGFGLCVADNKLFAVGKHGRSDPLEVEVYDIESKKWKIILNIPEKRIMSRATVALCLPK